MSSGKLKYSSYTQNTIFLNIVENTNKPISTYSLLFRCTFPNWNIAPVPRYWSRVFLVPWTSHLIFSIFFSLSSLHICGGFTRVLRWLSRIFTFDSFQLFCFSFRFATDKFSLSDLINPFCHLTNSSINKLGRGYAEQKDRVGAGEIFFLGDIWFNVIGIEK